jgi:hypothetical protein
MGRGARTPADDAEKPAAQGSYMKKLEEDMKRFQDATSASAPPKLEKESAEISPMAKVEQLREQFYRDHAEEDPAQQRKMQEQLQSMQDSIMHGRAPDVSTEESLLSNPIMSMAMKQMAQHPEIIQDAMEHDPMLHSMIAQNPQVAAMMHNPDTLRMLSDPAIMMQHLKEANARMAGMHPELMPSAADQSESDPLSNLMAKLHASHLRKD